jgi:hypothetical protein
VTDNDSEHGRALRASPARAQEAGPDERIPEFGDPPSVPFWEASARKEPALQKCDSCGKHQHYPRPFCIACDGEIAWVTAKGTGTIYSKTVVHMPVSPFFQPPYTVVVVQLDEGPRIMTNLVNGDAEIGAKVRVTFHEREDAPPLPMFEPA